MHIKGRLAIGALGSRLGRKSLNAQNVTKVDTILHLTRWTRSVGNEFGGEYQIFGNEFGNDPNGVGSNEEEKERIQTNRRKGNDFKNGTEPNGEQNGQRGHVQQVGSELVFLKSHGANARVNQTLGLSGDGEFAAGFLELCFEGIEFGIVQERFALEVGLHGGQVAGFLSIEGHHVTAGPLQIILEEIEFFVG